MQISKNVLKELEHNTYSLGEYNIVAYTQINYDSHLKKTLLPFMRNFDIGDGRTDFETYKRLHLLLWQNFVNKAQNKSCYFITEGALLHNQLLDIIGFYDLSEDMIISYFKKLIDIIGPMHPHLYYVYPSNIEMLIEHALSERGCEEGTWGYGFFRWLRYSDYGQRVNLSGKDGLVSVCYRLHELSLLILENTKLNFDMIERKM